MQIAQYCFWQKNEIFQNPYKAPVDENCQKWILNCFQEKYVRNEKDVMKAKNDVMEYLKKYVDDVVEKLHNDAVKEWNHVFHEFVNYSQTQ